MYIDLTHCIVDNMPVFPGDIPTALKATCTYDKDGVANHFLHASLHVGTHIDAPGHFTEIDKKISDYPVLHFIGRGVCVDARDRIEIDVETVAKYDFLPNDIVLFYTGWDTHFYDLDYFTCHPVITERCAQYLIEVGVKMVGVDFPSVDKMPYDIHKLLLRNDVLIIENMTRLGELLGKSFEVIALPMQIDAHGAPARCVARIDMMHRRVS